jgi:hypothetical protein
VAESTSAWIAAVSAGITGILAALTLLPAINYRFKRLMRGRWVSPHILLLGPKYAPAFSSMAWTQTSGSDLQPFVEGRQVCKCSQSGDLLKWAWVFMENEENADVHATVQCLELIGWSTWSLIDHHQEHGC